MSAGQRIDVAEGLSVSFDTHGKGERRHLRIYFEGDLIGSISKSPKGTSLYGWLKDVRKGKDGMTFASIREQGIKP